MALAVDLIVHQSRLKDGTRKITNITEVQGMEGDVIVMQDVFVFEQTGVVEGKIQGRLKATCIRPKFVEKFEVMGINLPPACSGSRTSGRRSRSMDTMTLVVAGLAAAAIIVIAMGAAMSGSGSGCPSGSSATPRPRSQRRRRCRARSAT